MDSSSSNCDEVDDLRIQLSSSADQSFTEITSHSILSGDSFAYCRTDSETSAFSGLADEINSYETASPLLWKGLDSPAGTALSRFSMRKHDIGILDDEIQDLGEVFSFPYRFFVEITGICKQGQTQIMHKFLK